MSTSRIIGSPTGTMIALGEARLHPPTNIARARHGTMRRSHCLICEYFEQRNKDRGEESDKDTHSVFVRESPTIQATTSAVMESVWSSLRPIVGPITFNIAATIAPQNLRDWNKVVNLLISISFTYPQASLGKVAAGSVAGSVADSADLRQREMVFYWRL